MATVLEGPSQLSVGDNGLPPESVIFGRSLAMQEVRRKIGRLASANVPVLVQGESGTGKEIIAQLIHRLSPWADGPLVKINCPAIPGSLLESELFGYEKGAFTGAYGTKPGRVEMAHRGTLFLDEIGELAPGLQAKLLQLLQDGQFCRIGAQEDKKVEVRVVCATNRDLDREVQEGRFRQDLFFRINVLSVRLPPLRERIEDVEGIVDYFLEFYRHKYNGGVSGLSPHMIRILENHSWPGNIRELENVIKRYVIFGSEDAITTDLLQAPGKPTESRLAEDGTVPLKQATRQAVQELDSRIILKVLQETRWNRKKAAQKLGISYRALLYKIRRAGFPSRKSAATL